MQTPTPMFSQSFQRILYKKIADINSISEHIPQLGQLLSQYLQRICANVGLL